MRTFAFFVLIAVGLVIGYAVGVWASVAQGGCG